MWAVAALAIAAVCVVGWLYRRVKREDEARAAMTLPKRWQPPGRQP
jgi:cbb3-type cytochrome oxidase subunit 3